MAAQRYLQCSLKGRSSRIVRTTHPLHSATKFRACPKDTHLPRNPTCHAFHTSTRLHNPGDDKEDLANVAFEPDTTIPSKQGDYKGEIYKRLSDNRAFRLVTLHPGLQGDIHLSVNETHLDNDVVYEALSYVCMDPYAEKSLGYSLPVFPTNGPKKLRPITLNGRVIGVTTNLYLALARLRFPTKPRVLWIDSLCIHQSDLEDKQQQLLLMKNIYPKARRVIIWLGEEDIHTEAAMRVVKRWSDIHRGTEGAYPPALLATLEASGEYEYEQQYFEALIRRAWFTRVWTLQEICLARDADVVCGRHSVSWTTFRHACATIINAGQREFVFEENSNIRAAYDISKLSWEKAKRGDSGGDERFRLSRLLQRTRLREATNLHDRLYALLGMATQPTRNKSAFKVDYSLPVQEVYTRYTREMIIEDGDLGVLSLVKRPQKDYLLKRKALRRRIRPIPNLPSWVPDLRHQDCVEYIVDNNHIRTRPFVLARTRFPQPIALQYNDRWPRYLLNLSQSYNVTGEILFDVKDPTKLGLFGLRVDRINKVFTMDKFHSDPFIRHPDERPSDPVTEEATKGKFDWKSWFDLPALMGNSKDKPVLENIYQKTGEAMPIAVLRTCSADLLPISKRLPQIQKKINFPRHFDWQYWYKRREIWKENLRPLPLTFLAISELVRIWRTQRTIWGPPDSNKRWTTFDYRALSNPDQCYRVYEEFFGTRLGKERRIKQFIYQKLTEYKIVIWTLWITIWIPYEAKLLNSITTKCQSFLEGLETSYSVFVLPGSAIVLLSFVGAHTLRMYLVRHAAPVASNLTVSKPMHGITDQVIVDEGVKMAIEVQDAINRISWSRVFFTTDTGYIGIGPIGTQPGDVVYSLIGGHVPFVLRPMDQKDEFKLMGESYVHGILDGELWTKRPGNWDNLEKMKSVASRVILV